MKQIHQFCPEDKVLASGEIIQRDFSYELQPFDELTVSFLNEVSLLLLKDHSFNRNPEIVSLGFWLRKANLLALQKENQNLLKNPNYRTHPLGLVFHIAPSNVDTIFLYSAGISLLMGNRNITRISSQSTPVVDFILSCIRSCMARSEFAVFEQYFKVITYEHDEATSTFFSKNSDCRVIWGGDNTVNYFRSLPSSVQTKDIFFPNRVSYAIFKAKEFLKASEKERQEVVHKFYNDAYVFDQMGCSSPKIIYVFGTNAEKEKFLEVFYKDLDVITRERYSEHAAGLSTIKFNALAGDVISHDVIQVKRDDSTIYLLEVKTNEMPDFNCGGGYFYVKHLQELKEIKSDIFSNSQTLAYFGLDAKELDALHTALKGKRIDRIVPVGEALSFHYIWDGINLFDELSRKRFMK